MSTARCLGDRDDRRGLDGSGHGCGHQADLSTSCRASFDRCLPGVGLDDLGGDATHSSLSGRSDGGSYRGWGCAVFHRGRFSRLACVALPEGYLARLSPSALDFRKNRYTDLDNDAASRSFLWISISWRHSSKWPACRASRARRRNVSARSRRSLRRSARWKKKSGRSCWTARAARCH